MKDELTILGKIWFSCLRPKEFFDYIEEEINVFKSILFFLLMLLIVLPLHFIMLGIMDKNFDLSVSADIIFNSIIGALFTFIILPFYHLFVYIFGGRKGIKRSAQTFLYGATPAILASWIPVLSFAAVFYSIYVTVEGLKKLHQMTAWRAFFAYLIPFLIILFFVVLSININFFSL